MLGVLNKKEVLKTPADQIIAIIYQIKDSHAYWVRYYKIISENKYIFLTLRVFAEHNGYSYDDIKHDILHKYLESVKEKIERAEKIRRVITLK